MMNSNKKPFKFLHGIFCLLFISQTSLSAAEPAFFKYLTGKQPARLVGYTPAELDPRNPNNNVTLKTSSIRADLKALRPAFDGLILYGYNEACTPRILAVAKELGYRAVLPAIWQPKSIAEVDGVANLVTQYQADFAMAVIIGNEGVLFGRYEREDLTIAHQRLRSELGEQVLLTTTEPLVSYKDDFILNFGDFVLPNIHPVFDLPDADATQAVEWVKGEANKLRERSGKSVLIKETGYPHAGKPKYTQQTQAEFWKNYTSAGLIEQHGKAWVSYAAGFEAFDLPWKAEASGLPIEKSWGLLSTERTPYPAFQVWQEISVE